MAKGAPAGRYAHPDGGLYVTQGESDGTQASVRSGILQRGEACCPHCYEAVKVIAYMQDATTRKKRKTQRKKVPLTVLLCPRTEEVFQWRGELPPEGTITSPAGHSFDPHRGHVTEKGRYICPHCGNNDSVIASVRALPEDQVLPVSAYGLQAYAPACDPAHDPARSGEAGPELFSANGAETESDDEEESVADTDYTGSFVPRTHNLVWKQSGKYYARHAAADQALYARAEKWWEENNALLPWPKSKVPSGEKTKSGLLAHNYRHWHQLFLPRQLLSLSVLLEGIADERDAKLRHLLLCAFSNTLEANNVFTRNIPARRTPGGTAPAGIFAGHHFQPKASFCEQNVWGTVSGNNTFISRMQALREGVAFAKNPYEGKFDEEGKHGKYEGLDPVPFDANARLICGDSRTDIPSEIAPDVVVTDPPYADNVNYSELADFFYVWLRLVLKGEDPQFAPEYCPKSAEIIENRSRGLSMADFENGLREVLQASADRVKRGRIDNFHFSPRRRQFVGKRSERDLQRRNEHRSDLSRSQRARGVAALAG